MRQCGRVLGVGVVAAQVLVGTVLAGEDLLRLGVEFQINAHTTAYQRESSVATDGDGEFVVTWSSYVQDGSLNGIFARRFGATGVPVAAEFMMNAFTSNDQRDPAVARDDRGEFVVVWTSTGQDGSFRGIFGRRFDSSGGALGSEFQVNTVTIDPQLYPAVDLDLDGDFVVTWTSFFQDGSDFGIFARRFNSSGTALASEIQVNEYTDDDQRNSAVSVESDGDFVVVWVSAGQDGAGDGIFSRRFTSAGVPGVEVQVNRYTTGVQDEPVVESNDDGSFVVAWHSEQDGSEGGVFARRFNAFGAPAGAELQVNEMTSGEQHRPALTTDDAGRFVIAWESYLQDGEYGSVFVRHFDSAGAPRGGEVLVNSYTVEDQSFPAIAGDRDFVVTWTGDQQDGDSRGIFAQRFTTPAVLDIDADGEVTALSDGILVLRYLFGFTGTTLTAGAVRDGCTRCNAAAIEPYLAGLV